MAVGYPGCWTVDSSLPQALPLWPASWRAGIERPGAGVWLPGSSPSSAVHEPSDLQVSFLVTPCLGFTISSTGPPVRLKGAGSRVACTQLNFGCYVPGPPCFNGQSLTFTFMERLGNCSENFDVHGKTFCPESLGNGVSGAPPVKPRLWTAEGPRII